MALERSICDYFESLVSEGRVETVSAFVAAIMYDWHGIYKSSADSME